MRLFHKQYLIFIAIVVGLTVVSAGAALLTKDWVNAHRSHSTMMPPVDWLGYEIDLSLAKTAKKIFPVDGDGLPQVRLYISEQAQKSLLSDVPVSTKKWQRAYRLNEDGFLEKVKVRHRGDNPVNWMYGRKSWRDESSKDKIRDGIRNFD